MARNYNPREVYSGSRRRGFSARWLFAFLIPAMIIAAAAYTVYDNGRVILTTVRVTVSNLPAALEGFTILQASDLSGARFGSNQRLVGDLAAKTNCDAVVITGDFTAPDGDTLPFFELITALSRNASSAPVFVIPGDADPAPDGETLNDWLTGARRLGARLLDSTVSITKRGQTVWLTPESMLLEPEPEDALAMYRAEIADMQARGYDRSIHAVLENAQRAADALERETAVRPTIQPADLHIVVSHRPVDEARASLINAWASSGNEFYRSIDAYIAGHLAGGQWRLPYVGAIYSPGYGFFPRGIDGFMYVDGLAQTISSGLGRSSDTPYPWFRLFNPPELTRVIFTRDAEY
ncbi:MAG: metallophosphoesterase [Oscillospiraceae bacterium]|jgi:predicted MPP superfamily phosphohydrolase|nr:metallophosphoesterase [Oscillospiraceae bacterium]